MIGNVWEWTTDWYSHKHDSRCAEGLLHSGKSARRTEAASYDPCQPQDQDSTQGAQGRLASLRAQLLPPLSAGRAPCRAGRHVNEPCRLQVHHREEEERVMSKDKMSRKACERHDASRGRIETPRSLVERQFARWPHRRSRRSV